MSATVTTPETMNPDIRKKVLRMIPYGMFVITAKHDDKIAAGTIDWVTQSSFEPPMVVCCLRKDSLIYSIVTGAKKYAIHPLGADQKPYAMHFFKNKDANAAQINGQSYQLSAAGNPILDEPPASFELEMVNQLTESDHAVILGKVTTVTLKKEVAPLLLKDTGWHYGG
jgi:flavin reductase (DIM6/NTAB) family NADH-FMN oxidoreductase RutF